MYNRFEKYVNEHKFDIGMLVGATSALVGALAGLKIGVNMLENRGYEIVRPIGATPDRVNFIDRAGRNWYYPIPKVD